MKVSLTKPLLSFLSLILLLSSFINGANDSQFPIVEATIADIQLAFADGRLTSRQLVDFYIDQIERLNPLLRSVLEINPDARSLADEADWERESTTWRDGKSLLGELHGVPVLLKDSIATKDALNTTMGSYTLLGSVSPRDATVVERLRRAGAVIMGKASLSEWYGARSWLIPYGWCGRGGQGVNPYVELGDPCGSSSGSAISVAASMVAVSLGTETDASIICPADHNSVVGIKPTVGLTSRAGVVPVSPRQDTIGTVSDAVYVLDAIVGYDPRDHEATNAAAKFIPLGGYKQFLKEKGLKGKRLGVVRNPFLDIYNGSSAISTFECHLKTLRQGGATVIDHLEIENIDIINDAYQSGEGIALTTEFKVELNKYLHDLVNSPVKSLADIIAFNLENPELELMTKYGQEQLIAAEMTNGIGEDVFKAVDTMKKLSENGFEKLMKENELDAMVTLGWGASTVLAIGGYPAISVPAGYELSSKMPFGICFGGLKGTEPKLIEIAYAFEQATMVRRPPPIVRMGPIFNGSNFSIKEATIADIQRAFADGRLTSQQLVDYYIDRISRLDPQLHDVLEVNPDARCQADKADEARKEARWRDGRSSLGELHGVPVLLKDNIATKDALDTTTGSYVLLGSKVQRDATVLERLRGAAAVILGKATLTEWYRTRSSLIPNDWSARGGQVMSSKSNPPLASLVASVLSQSPHVRTQLGNKLQPMGRTVSDAVYVFDAIVGYDSRDHNAIEAAAKFIPKGGYKQFLKNDGLKGKRLGVVRNAFLAFYNGIFAISTFETHLSTLRYGGATIIDHLEVANKDIILDPFKNIIAFNSDNPDLEMTKKYGQEQFVMADMTSALGEDGFEKLMKESELDAMVTLGWAASTVLAIGGYPAISVPAGFESSNEMPFGLYLGD
ncbi:hypothetical protein F8388_014189 [Cannabis sativa]|uniref:Amidase domain-containing protein n=1 Tax=Cannabis sativa TaxID=3483 RepID=A0A7J6GNL1_CANSA|nr:hypothetical protein F8388_014189 [Cannabis sativa]